MRYTPDHQLTGHDHGPAGRTRGVGIDPAPADPPTVADGAVGEVGLFGPELQQDHRVLTLELGPLGQPDAQLGGRLALAPPFGVAGSARGRRWWPPPPDGPRRRSARSAGSPPGPVPWSASISRIRSRPRNFLARPGRHDRLGPTRAHYVPPGRDRSNGRPAPDRRRTGRATAVRPADTRTRPACPPPRAGRPSRTGRSRSAGSTGVRTGPSEEGGRRPGARRERAPASPSPQAAGRRSRRPTLRTLLRCPRGSRAPPPAPGTEGTGRGGTGRRAWAGMLCTPIDGGRRTPDSSGCPSESAAAVSIDAATHSWTSSISVPNAPLGWTNATVVPRDPGRGASSMTWPPWSFTDWRADAAVRHPVADMMEAGPLPLQVLGHRRVVVGGGEQLDVAVGHLQEGLFDPIGLDHLPVVDRGAEGVRGSRRWPPRGRGRRWPRGRSR